SGGPTPPLVPGRLRSWPERTPPGRGQRVEILVPGGCVPVGVRVVPVALELVVQLVVVDPGNLVRIGVTGEGGVPCALGDLSVRRPRGGEKVLDVAGVLGQSIRLEGQGR